MSRSKRGRSTRGPLRDRGRPRKRSGGAIRSPQLDTGQLSAALSAAGVLVGSRFKVPASQLVADLFVPAFPRALVFVFPRIDEISAADLASMRARLGPSLLVVLAGAVPGALARAAKTEHSCVVVASRTPVAAAGRIAGELVRRGLRLQTRTPTAPSSSNSSGRRQLFCRPRGTETAERSDTRHRGAISNRLIAVGDFDSVENGDPRKGHPAKKPVVGLARRITKAEATGMGKYTPNPGRDGAGKTADALVSTFNDVLPANEYLVLKHEVDYLLAEFREHHFTSCALRAGRCLEYVVYSLATGWGVPVDERTLLAISQLRDGADQLSDAVVKYCGLRGTPSARSARTALADQITRIHAHLNTLMLSLDEDPPRVETPTPRNTGALLRAIRRQFARSPAARKELDELMSCAEMKRINTCRNDAAHASTTGAIREVERGVIDKLLDDLSHVLLRLSNVGTILRTERLIEEPA